MQWFTKILICYYHNMYYVFFTLCIHYTRAINNEFENKHNQAQPTTYIRWNSLVLRMHLMYLKTAGSTLMVFGIVIQDDIVRSQVGQILTKPMAISFLPHHNSYQPNKGSEKRSCPQQTIIHTVHVSSLLIKSNLKSVRQNKQLTVTTLSWVLDQIL